MAMKLIVNGVRHVIADSPPRLLLWALRDGLGLKDTRVGCISGHCGACTVLVDGEPVRSCVTLASSVAERNIVTLTGLPNRRPDGRVEWHPVQKAFCDAGVPDCDHCMNARIVTAAAFLEQYPNPSEGEIEAFLTATECYCGSEQPIAEALKLAASRSLP